MAGWKSHGLALLNWFYPKKCLLCQKSLSYLERQHLCHFCVTEIERLEQCRDAFVYSYGPFKESLRELIHFFKYKGLDYLSKELALFLYKIWQENPSLQTCEILLPVPLHSATLRERGYNQSQLLALQLQSYIRAERKENNPQILEETLLRVKNSPSQTQGTKEQRKLNLEGTFLLKEKDRIRGKEVLLIDDVITTGSTLSSCRELLLLAGAKKVLGLTLARD